MVLPFDSIMFTIFSQVRNNHAWKLLDEAEPIGDKWLPP